MQWVAITSFLLLTANVASAENGTVEIRRQGDIVRIFVDDVPFAVYQASKVQPKPSFVEIRSPDGTLVSRPLPSPGAKDEHHHGLWIAVDDVNGVDFWHEEGRIENASVEIVSAEGNPAAMKVVNHWLDADSNLVVRETTEIKFFANRLLSFDIQLAAGEQPITFGDTEEGFLAFRLVDSMCEEQSGRVVNADGVTSAARCWGRTSAWVDYCGLVDGKMFGVAIFDHPDNFRPSRYHVRDYGLFTVSPFGEHAYSKGRLPARPAAVSPGRKLRLRYAVYIHAGDTRSGDVPPTHRRYVSTTH